MRYLYSERYVGSHILLTSVRLTLLHIFLSVDVKLPDKGKDSYFRYWLYFWWKATTDAQHGTCLKGHHKLTSKVSTVLPLSIFYFVSIHRNQKKVQVQKSVFLPQKVASCPVLLSKLLLHCGWGELVGAMLQKNQCFGFPELSKGSVPSVFLRVSHCCKPEFRVFNFQF